MSNLMHNNSVIILKCDSTNSAPPRTWAILHRLKTYLSLGSISLLQDFSFPNENLSKCATISRARVHQLWAVTLHRLSWPCFPSIQNAATKTIFGFFTLMIMDSYLQQQTQKCLKTFKVPLSRAYLYPSFLICYWAIDPNSARDTSLRYPVKKISEDN